MYICHAFPEGHATLPLYFCTCCSHYKQESIYRPQGLGASLGPQLLFVTDGTGVLYVDGKEYPLKKGVAFYLDVGLAHRYVNLERLTTAWITCCGSGFAEISHYIGQKSFLFCEGTNVTRYVAKIEEIEREYFGKRREGILSAMTYSLYLSFFDEQLSAEPSAMDRALHYMEENHGKKITLQQLLTVSRCSRSSFCKSFKETFGCSAFEKLTEIRLQNARLLLQMNPQEKVCSIAATCGFEDVSYFCRAYKKAFGSSPSQERNS